MGTAVVFAGGPVEGRHPPERALGSITADLVVAADSGLDLALARGWSVDLVVGDMDSVSETALAELEAGSGAVRRHPADKDATDLELALDEVLDAGMDRVVVLGSPAGRMDHLLGAAATLSSPRYAALEVDAWLGGAALYPVHRHRTVVGRQGSTVSILPMHGPALGVTTSGLRWPLHGETLDAGTTRGISNEMVAAQAAVSVEHGCAVVVVPDQADDGDGAHISVGGGR